MKTLLVAGVVLALAGCGGPKPSTPNPDGPKSRLSDTRQVPSNYTPGVNVSGHVNVGVVKTF